MAIIIIIAVRMYNDICLGIKNKSKYTCTHSVYLGMKNSMTDSINDLDTFLKQLLKLPRHNTEKSKHYLTGRIYT